MKTYFEYKGYIGTVALSVEDNCFFGTVHGINDLISFEGETVDELKTAFQDAIDDYLSFCRECNIEPDKAYKGQFNVRINPALHKAIATEAIKNNTSLNQMVESAISTYLDYQRHPHINIFHITSRQIGDYYKPVSKGGWLGGKNKPLQLIQGGMQ